MVARFIALPVGQGDAFYLATCRGSVLVDGGRGKKALVRLFKQYVQCRHVDILVVTHNDVDHINGILGFLESTLAAGELWLPARFAQVLPHLLLRSQEEVVMLLLDQVARVPVEHLKSLRATDGEHVTIMERYTAWPRTRPEARSPTHVAILEQYAALERWHGEDDLGAETLHAPEGSGWPIELQKVLAKASELEQVYDPVWHWLAPERARRIIYSSDIPPMLQQLAVSALLAGHRIRRLALLAWQRNIPVRWFQHDPAHPRGGTPWLRPLSAHEITLVRCSKVEKLLLYLALTVANRESLAFWAPADPIHGGVLFTGDSDLKGVMVTPHLSTSLVTAPHHGSEANAGVYRVLQSPAWWIRSDGRFPTRPGPSYRKAMGNKACTVCQRSAGTKTAVCFIGHRGVWYPFPGVRHCTC